MAEDIAALNDVTGPEVLKVLEERFSNHQYDTWCGGALLAFNPCWSSMLDEANLGRQLTKSKPLTKLVPSVLTLAHRIYQIVGNNVLRPHAVLITGRPGSGKTKVACSLVSQFLRESRLSPTTGLGPRIIMAQHMLNALVSSRTHRSPSSTRTIKVTTLYFQTSGVLAGAEIGSWCQENFLITPHASAPDIFFAMMAGMDTFVRQQYYLMECCKLLDVSGIGCSISQEDFNHHIEIYDLFVSALSEFGLNITDRNYAGNDVLSLLSVLSAILHLGNVEFSIHPQTGFPVVTSYQELRAAADLLLVNPDYLESVLISTTKYVKGEPLTSPCTLDQCFEQRDCIMSALYRHLVSWITSKLNLKLAPKENTSSLTPVRVIESVGFENTHTNNFDIFLRNMASERLQLHLNELIFTQDIESCEEEHVKPYRIKYTTNSDLVDAMLMPEVGLLSIITASTTSSQDSSYELVRSFDKILKKHPWYIKRGKSQPSTVFSIQHASGQVMYDASEFLTKNKTAMPGNFAQLLAQSRNPVIAALTADVKQRGSSSTGLDQVHIVSANYQKDLSYIIHSLSTSNLSYVRCLLPNKTLTSTVFDQAEVTSQLKEANIVEVAKQQKFGFSTCISHENFVSSFRTIAFDTLAQPPSLPQACDTILTKAKLKGKGPLQTKSSVFLRYWHIYQLNSLKTDNLRKVVIVQSHVRGFLVRQRFGYRQRLREQTGGFSHISDCSMQRGSPSWQSDHHQYGQNYYSEVSPYNNHEEEEGRYYNQFNNRESVMTKANSVDQFYFNALQRTMSSLGTLAPHTWAKIIYMERDTEVGKVYVDEHSVIVDGSDHMFDGERFGIRSFNCSDQDAECGFYRAHIGLGLRLFGDADGNIWASRLGRQPIIVNGLNKSDFCLSADVIKCRGVLPLEQSIKIFDIKEFHIKIGLDLRLHFSMDAVRQACAIGLSFGLDVPEDDLLTPCWLCVINIRALKALNSKSLLRDIRQQTAKLELTSQEELEEKRRLEAIKEHYSRPKWSKTDQRDHLRAKEASARHLRQELRAKGLEIGPRMGYSWQSQKDSDSEKTTMSIVQQWAGPGREIGASHGAQRLSKQHRWAKIQAAIRDDQNKAAMKDADFGDPPESNYGNIY